VPLVIGLGIAIGIGWQFAVVPALALVGIAIAANWGRRDSAAKSMLVHGRLPSSFWLPWFLVLLVVAMEFAVVFWGSTLVERRTDVSLADATLTISAFVAGMIVARLAFSSHALSSHDPVWLMRIGIILALAGTLLVWATPSYEVSATGMFIIGIGVGLLYPLAASMALAAAPSQAPLASARVVMGTGLAILVAPLLLGVVADMTDVVAAWLLIPAACVVSLALTVPLARVHDGHEPPGIVRT
jgi:fucose permease